jgi:hypothetical protein
VVLAHPAVVVLTTDIDASPLLSLTDDSTGYNIDWLIARRWPIGAVGNRDRTALDAHLLNEELVQQLEINIDFHRPPPVGVVVGSSPDAPEGVRLLGRLDPQRFEALAPVPETGGTPPA